MAPHVLFMLNSDFSPPFTDFQSLGYTCSSPLWTFPTQRWHDVGEFSSEKGLNSCVMESSWTEWLPVLSTCWPSYADDLSKNHRRRLCTEGRTRSSLQYLRRALMCCPLQCGLHSTGFHLVFDLLVFSNATTFLEFFFFFSTFCFVLRGE